VSFVGGRTSPRLRARLVALLALALACLALAGCPTKGGRARASGPRVVSLSPSTTEALFAMGAGGAMVGRSRYCDYPKEALALPQVGGYVDPNQEAILALEPTLVTGARGPSGSTLVDSLAARGIATFFPITESFAEIDAMILGLGARTAHDEGARALVDRMHARIAAIEAATAGKPRVKALLVFGLEPVVVAGPGTFADEMLTRAGAVNVVREGKGYPTLGVETVLALDPDVVLNAAIAEAHGAERIGKETPGWRELRAVKAGRVVALTDEAVLRPGPRIGDGLAQLARAVHPEANVP
jgi:iron complex transport system substrate-binding protein